MKNKNKIRMVLVASIVAMAMVMIMPAAMGAPDTETLRPNAAGTYQTGWTTFGTGDYHWDRTSDQNDATGVQITDSTTSKETENLTDPTFPDASTINSVTVYARCGVVDGAKAPEKGVIITRTGGTDYASDAFGLSDSPVWTDHSVVYTENPGGGSWTKAQIAALEVGSKADTLDSGDIMQCSEYWIVVDYSAASDTTPPTWDTTPGGLQSATDTGNGGEVMLTYGTATDADTPPVKYNVYYNTSSPATGEGHTKISNVYLSPYTVTGLTNGQLYYFTVRAEDSATPPNEDNNMFERNATPTAPPATPPTPYIIKYGYVFYEKETACNGPVVNVTNQATGKEWQAETYDTSHYYELILDSKNVSADNVLEFDARDTAATQFNTTQHTVTQTELDDGGLFNFNLTLHPEEEENVVDNFATADIPVEGTVTNNHTYTHTSNDGYESIEEYATAGNPSSRISYLEHKWTINIPGGTKTNITFCLEAYRTDSGEGDEFVFAYSPDDSNYTNMTTVTKTTDDDTYQNATLPNDLSDTVYIRVMDTDRKVGHGDKDTIYIDHMFIRSVLGAPDEIPPSQVKNVTVTTVSSSQLNVSWTKNEELDLKHYKVYRNETQGFTPTESSFVDETTTNYYLDSGLKASTTYYYRVTAVDDSENEGTASEEAWNTTEAELPPTPYIVKYGYVFDKDGNDCNGPIVNVTNQAKTWQAETNESYNYYELILDSKNVSANDMLEFNARDTAATQFNTTQHAVTPDEINDGGLFNFNLTLEGGNTMHVDNISMWYTMTGPNYKIHTKVRIFNSSNGPVANATVYLNLTLPLPDGTNVSSFDITLEDGTVEFTYGAKKNEGNYTSTVTGVIKPDWTYDSDANVDTSKTLPVP